MLRKIAIAAARSLWSAGCVGCETGDILGRYVMYKKLGEQFAGHDLGDRVLSISHSRKSASNVGDRFCRNENSSAYALSMN